MAVALLLTTATASAAKRDGHALQAMLQASSPGSTVACPNNKYGNPACTVDGVEVEAGDDCTLNMSFGGVTADRGTTLAEGFKPSGATPVAHVGRRQLLCVLATQREAGVLIRALVKVVPTKTVKYCKGSEMCKGADTPVEWKRPASGVACTLKPDGHYTGDCATGWVDGKDIEEYSMGLKPEDDGA
ncbi:MAG: hypothetical protein ABWX83_16045 [Luteibacter sp.]